MTRRRFSQSTWTTACSPRHLLLHQTILFVVHVDQVIVFEDFRDQDDLFRTLRVLPRRRQGQARPDDVIRSLRALIHDLRGISRLDGVFSSPRRIRRHLRGVCHHQTMIFIVNVDYGVFSEVFFYEIILFVFLVD